MPNCPEADFDKKYTKVELVMPKIDSYGIYQESFEGQLIHNGTKMNLLLPDYFDRYSSQVSGERLLIYQEPPASKRYYLFADNFVSKFQKNGKNFLPDYDTNFILNNSLYLIEELINIGVDNISFEFTEDQSILFISNLSDLNVYCEVYFDNENELNEIEVITNIYKDHKQIFTSASDLIGAIGKISYIKSETESTGGETIPVRNIPEATRPAEPLPDYRSVQFTVF